MKATNLDLIGENKWGQATVRRIYSDENGQKFVGLRKRGSVRKTMVPYRTFANTHLSFWYILDREGSKS